ncbi:hypothetical protein FBY04_110166 [Pseudomonas sp. SJZ080]|nr:hypothetical protein FBY04_110166 [Pseudomonas sp. SJZ080]
MWQRSYQDIRLLIARDRASPDVFKVIPFNEKLPVARIGALDCALLKRA